MVQTVQTVQLPHRIGDLEKQDSYKDVHVYLPHRIGDLENSHHLLIPHHLLPHRIGDLEMTSRDKHRF